MPTLAWIPCPHCGFQNIPEKRYCKRCRGFLRVPPSALSPVAATEETVTLYPDETGRRLLTVCCLWLEYDAPDVAFRTSWSNLTTIHRALWDYHLYMLQEPKLFRADWRHMSRASWDKLSEPTFPERRISLNGFGFSENKMLCADLRRYAPQLSKYIPK